MNGSKHSLFPRIWDVLAVGIGAIKREFLINPSFFILVFLPVVSIACRRTIPHVILLCIGVPVTAHLMVDLRCIAHAYTFVFLFFKWCASSNMTLSHLTLNISESGFASIPYGMLLWRWAPFWVFRVFFYCFRGRRMRGCLWVWKFRSSIVPESLLEQWLMCVKESVWGWLRPFVLFFRVPFRLRLFLLVCGCVLCCFVSDAPFHSVQLVLLGL